MLYFQTQSMNQFKDIKFTLNTPLFLGFGKVFPFL